MRDAKWAFRFMPIAVLAFGLVGACDLVVDTSDLDDGRVDARGDSGSSDGAAGKVGEGGQPDDDDDDAPRDAAGPADGGSETGTGDAGEGGSLLDAPGGVCTTGQKLEISGAPKNVSVAALLGSPSCVVDVIVHIQASTLVGSSDPAQPALLVDGLAPGSTINIVNEGRIQGAGGAGGAGGNGGGGSGSSCGRPGNPGGSAIRLDVPAMIQQLGTGGIYGGGGGGAGTSGCNANAGGGGGAGSVGGAGGAGATTLDSATQIAYCGQDNKVRIGTVGQAGAVDIPGASTPLGGCDGFLSGGGGKVGLPGDPSNEGGFGPQSPGGRAGYAIELHNGATTNIASGTYATGTGAIRGSVTAL